MPIGAVREPGAANQILEPGVALERQVIRPDNGASYFWANDHYPFDVITHYQFTPEACGP